MVLNVYGFKFHPGQKLIDFVLFYFLIDNIQKSSAGDIIVYEELSVSVRVRIQSQIWCTIAPSPLNSETIENCSLIYLKTVNVNSCLLVVNIFGGPAGT